MGEEGSGIRRNPTVIAALIGAAASIVAAIIMVMNAGAGNRAGTPPAVSLVGTYVGSFTAGADTVRRTPDSSSSIYDIKLTLNESGNCELTISNASRVLDSAYGTYASSPGFITLEFPPSAKSSKETPPMKLQRLASGNLTIVSDPDIVEELRGVTLLKVK